MSEQDYQQSSDVFLDCIEQDEFLDCIDHGDEPQSTQEDTVYQNTQYQLPKQWTFEEQFEFESEEIENLFEIKNGINTSMSEAMMTYNPHEKVMEYGSKPSRLVFYSDQEDFRDNELAEIKNFKDFCEEKDLMIPERDNEILRFLYSKKFDYQKAYDAAVARTNFRIKNFPAKLNRKVYELVSSGFMYISGRDKCYRPIICLRSKIIQQMNPLPSGEDIISSTLLIFEYIQHFMESPGHIENISLIIDSKGANVMTIPYNLISQIVGVIPSNYKCIARAIYILNAPYVFAMAWKSITYLLDENTSRKIQITSGNSCDNLIDQIAPNQLEQQFGGTAKNKEILEFWPPNLPDMEFGCSQ